MSEDIRAVVGMFGEKPVYLSEVVRMVGPRGYDLLLIVLTLPFLTPIPLPLVSTPLGIIVLFAGMRLALGRRPWWPEWVLSKPLPRRFFPQLLRATARIVQVIEYVVKPRLEFLHDWVFFQRMAGVLIAAAGGLLLLPVPVPFSNFFPACTVLLLAAGALERDGLFFIAGCAMFVVAAAYFALLFFGGWEAVSGLLSKG